MQYLGKIKTISVSELTNDMDVVINQGTHLEICKVLNAKYRDLISLDGNKYRGVSLDEIKVLVIEYYVELDISGDLMSKHQIPLKHTQWKSAIENDEVDIDKIITFELKNYYRREKDNLVTHSKSNMYKLGGTWITCKYGEIIPKRTMRDDIIDAYIRIRKIDNTIPDEILDLMKESALKNIKENPDDLTFEEIFQNDGLYVGDNFAEGTCFKVENGILRLVTYSDENMTVTFNEKALVYDGLFKKKYRKVYNINSLFRKKSKKY